SMRYNWDRAPTAFERHRKALAAAILIAGDSIAYLRERRQHPPFSSACRAMASTVICGHRWFREIAVKKACEKPVSSKREKLSAVTAATQTSRG
ncbi:MAG: hypothetical protein E5W21_29690, partial [Mesorhizobium sp.]